MTGRRSRSARSAALAVLLALGCSTGATLGCSTAPRARATRHFLEDPPPSPDLVGKLRFHEASADETLIDLAPELGVGYVELVAANPGIDPWLPPDGTRLVVPSVRLVPSGRREGIVVNLGDLRLYFFEPGQPVRSFPIGIAKDGYATPLGVTQVKDKKEKPTWVPGPTARRDGYPAVVKPGPDNPLGEYALYLGWPSYLIHGTNEPRGVGRHSSRGCIRLYPDDIAELYPRVAAGTPVRVVNEPVKLGWIGSELYLEVNPDAEQSFELDEKGKLAKPRAPSGLRALITRAAGKEAKRLDWARIERAGLRRSGVPLRITQPVGTPPSPTADARAPE